jgi:hypothetical protein
MKTLLIALVVAALSLGLYAVRTLESAATDVLKTLNIPEPVAKECIWSSFRGMYLSYPNVTNLKKTARGDRAAIVRQIGEFAKAYSKSPEFKAKYLDYRTSEKPTPPEKPKSMEQNRKEQKENLDKAIRETEQNMKSLSPDVQKTMKEVLTGLREQRKSLDDPNNPMFSKQMDEMITQGYDMQVKDYNERVAKWEKDRPLPDAMVRDWLEEFLKVSSDIDFNAKLIDGGGGRMVFANPQYEKKSPHWKMCYRAGKEAVEAGRAFASQWLKELASAK